MKTTKRYSVYESDYYPDNMVQFYQDWLNEICSDTEKEEYLKRYPIDDNMIEFPKELHNEIYHQQESEFEYFLENIKSIDKSVIIAHGNCGTWRGPREACKVFYVNNLSEAIRQYMKCYDKHSDISFRFYVEGGKFICVAPHHDATDYFEFSFLNKNQTIENESDPDEIRKQLKKYGKPLGKLVKNIYGFK